MALDFEDVKDKFDDVNKRIDRQDMRIESIEKNQNEIIVNQARFEATVTTRFDGIEKLIKDDTEEKRKYENKLLDHLIKTNESKLSNKHLLINKYVDLTIKLVIITVSLVLGVNNLNL